MYEEKGAYSGASLVKAADSAREASSICDVLGIGVDSRI
jgi:hypothetical protein